MILRFYYGRMKICHCSHVFKHVRLSGETERVQAQVGHLFANAFILFDEKLFLRTAVDCAMNRTLVNHPAFSLRTHDEVRRVGSSQCELDLYIPEVQVPGTQIK